MSARAATLAVIVTMVFVTIVGCSSAPVQTRPPGSVYVSAKDVAFVQSSVEAPVGAAFQLYFENLENVPHNVEVIDPTGASVARGEVFTGPSGQTLALPALAAGHYRLLCDVHPETMRADLVVGLTSLEERGLL